MYERLGMEKTAARLREWPTFKPKDASAEEVEIKLK